MWAQAGHPAPLLFRDGTGRALDAPERRAARRHLRAPRTARPTSGCSPATCWCCTPTASRRAARPDCHGWRAERLLGLGAAVRRAPAARRSACGSVVEEFGDDRARGRRLRADRQGQASAVAGTCPRAHPVCTAAGESSTDTWARRCGGRVGWTCCTLRHAWPRSTDGRPTRDCRRLTAASRSAAPRAHRSSTTAASVCGSPRAVTGGRRPTALCG